MLAPLKAFVVVNMEGRKSVFVSDHHTVAEAYTASGAENGLDPRPMYEVLTRLEWLTIMRDGGDNAK